MTQATDVENGQPMPEWLAAQWQTRIVPLLAATIVKQEATEKARIFDALDRGATIDFAIDEDRERVIFGVDGLALCEMSYDVIVGIRMDGTTH